MRTEQDFRNRYADILEEDDDEIYLCIVSDLDSIYRSRCLPTTAQAQMVACLSRRSPRPKVHNSIRLLNLNGVVRMRRAVLAALIIAVAGVGVGTSGLAVAAVDAIQTHLFSAPPHSPQSAVWVGSLDTPLSGGCAPRRVTSPVTVPRGRQIAELEPIPNGFTASIGVTFPPCADHQPPPGAVPPPRQPASLTWENITIQGVVRYVGIAGTLRVVTARATDEGMRRGLYLGNPIGTLADGSSAFTLTGDVRWLKDGQIISVSGDMPVDRLKQIASDVVLK